SLSCRRLARLGLRDRLGQTPQPALALGLNRRRLAAALIELCAAFFLRIHAAQVVRESAAQRLGFRALGNHPLGVYLPMAVPLVVSPELRRLVLGVLAILAMNLTPSTDQPCAVRQDCS